MTNDERPDEARREARLAKLIGATRATSDPAVLARAFARIRASERTPGIALWLARPVVLAGAGALFVACLTGTFVISRSARATAGTTETNLISTLVGEEDLGLPVAAGDIPPGGAANSGARGDSGEVPR